MGYHVSRMLMDWLPCLNNVNGWVTMSQECSWIGYHVSRMFMTWLPCLKNVNEWAAMSQECWWMGYHVSRVLMDGLPCLKNVDGWATMSQECSWIGYQVSRMLMNGLPCLKNIKIGNIYGSFKKGSTSGKGRWLFDYSNLFLRRIGNISVILPRGKGNRRTQLIEYDVFSDWLRVVFIPFKNTSLIHRRHHFQ